MGDGDLKKSKFEVAISAHNAMSDEYDDLNDLWYPWLFAQMHDFLADSLERLKFEGRPRAVDAGCGSGFQAFLLARAGFDVVGFDLSEGLLALAEKKIPEHAAPPLEGPDLFGGDLEDSWIEEHHRSLARRLEKIRAGREVRPPRFLKADVNGYDYGAGELDAIACCGSVLNFVEEYGEAIERMAAGLRPGGLLVLEVEQKMTADLLWPIVNRMAGGAFGYKQNMREAVRNILTPPGKSILVEYPFDLECGDCMNIPMRLFSLRELEAIFRGCGLRVSASLAIHNITSIVPSLVLMHHVPPDRRIKAVFELLRPADAALGGMWPFRRLGCNVIYRLEKRKR